MHSIRTFGFFDCVSCFVLSLSLCNVVDKQCCHLSVVSSHERREEKQRPPAGSRRSTVLCVYWNHGEPHPYAISVMQIEQEWASERVRELDILFPFLFTFVVLVCLVFCLGLGRRRQGKMPRRWKTSIVGDDHIDSHWLADESDDILAATRAFPYRWQAVQAGKAGQINQTVLCRTIVGLLKLWNGMGVFRLYSVMSFFRSEPDGAIDSADGKRLLPKREKKRERKRKKEKMETGWPWEIETKNGFIHFEWAMGSSIWHEYPKNTILIC